MPETFGPSVYFDKDTKEPVARCAGGGCWCFLLSGNLCRDHKPPRELPEGSDLAPDWCKYRDSMIEDAREMRDFDRMGLTDMTRDALLTEARSLPPEFRPKPLHKAKAHQLRRAIREARNAA